MFKNIVLNLFKWENVPTTMCADYLEKTLYRNGMACVVNDENLGYINTLVAPQGNLNIYEYNTSYRAYTVIGDVGVYDFDSPKFFLVKNNICMTPTQYIVSIYAYKVFKTDCAIETNIDLQKFSGLMLCDEKERLTIKNIISQWSENIPLIIGDKSLNLEEKLKSINFNIPYVADKLYAHKDKLISEFLTFIGVNNVQTEKKERLITDEVNANNQLIQGNMLIWLNARQEFCNTFNERTGLNIKVKPNIEYIQSMRGVDYNEQIYNDSISDSE